MTEIKKAVKFEQTIETFLHEINESYKNNTDLNFNNIKATKRGKKQLRSLWEMTHFYTVEENNIVRGAQKSDGNFEIRSIPVAIKNSGKIEEIVITCSENAEIVDIEFAIELHRYDVLVKGTSVEDSLNRKTILDFLETYRNAYINKDLSFLKKIFSEQALIIVGKELKTKKADGRLNKQVEFLKLTKQEYIERLKSVFKTNDWIDIQFSRLNLVQHFDIQNIYAVNLTQRYQSSTYSDEGYLFLLLDFRKPENPLIHVRVWQPSNTVEEANAFSLGDLEIF